MPRNSNRSVGEIAENPEVVDEEPEEVAEITMPGGRDDEELSPRALDYADLDSLEHAPSVQSARETAKIPPHFPMAQLVDRTIYIVHKRHQKAALPNTGEIREGFFCLCVFADDKSEFTTWIGQTILYRELTQLALPFKTTVTKRGRTYMFS